MATTIAGAIAERLGRQRSDIAALEGGASDLDYWNAFPEQRAAILLLLTLSGADASNAARISGVIKSLRTADGTMGAAGFVAWMVRSLKDYTGARDDLLARYAYRSTITIELGDSADDLAVCVRCTTEDQPADDVVFTVDGSPYRPDRRRQVSAAMAVSGRLLFQLAADLADLEAAHVA